MNRNISVKDLASLKTLKNYVNNKFEGKKVEDIFKTYIAQSKIDTISYTSSEAWDNIYKHQKIKVEKFKKNYFLFNYEQHIFPFFYRTNFAINSIDNFIKYFGEDTYKKIGTYSLLNQSNLKKVCNLKTKSTIDDLMKVLPNELKKYIEIVQTSSFSLKRNVIKDADIINTIKKLNLFELFEKYINNPDYLLKKELERKIDNYIKLSENFYLTDKNKNNKEVLNYFNYKISNSLKLKENFEFNQDLNQFFTLKISNKKLHELIENEKLNIENLDKYGIEKKDILFLFDEVKTLEELKKWEKNNIFNFFKNSSLTLDSYLQKIKDNCNFNPIENIKKHIKKR